MIRQMITVFIPTIKKVVDTDYGPIVYNGKLTIKQIMNIALQIGNDMNYINARVTKLYEDQWSIEFKEPYDRDDEWSGELAYIAIYTTVHTND